MITPHLQTMATSLYGFLSLYPAIRLTNQEYKLKTEEEVDVQSQVEKPEIHTDGRSRKLTLHEINENFYNPR